MSRTQAVLDSLATPCLRPPYGSTDAFTRDWAAAHGLTLQMWTVDPADWRRPPAGTMADHVVQRARAGEIVLMHDGGGDRSRTVRALEMVLERLSGSSLRYEPLCVILGTDALRHSVTEQDVA